MDSEIESHLYGWRADYFHVKSESIFLLDRDASALGISVMPQALL